MKEDQLRRFDTRDFYIFFKLSTVSRWGKVTKPRAGFLEGTFQKHYLNGPACQLGVTQNSRHFRQTGIPSKFQAEWQGGLEGDSERAR